MNNLSQAQMYEFKRRQLMSNLYSLIHRRPYGACVPGGKSESTPEEYVDFVVACEYRDLDESQQYGARLLVNGKEFAFGTTFTAKNGQSIQLEVEVIGNEAADFIEWSNGEKSSKITIVAGEFSEITAVVSKVSGSDFPDPSDITELCKVFIPNNIIDGNTVTGTELDTTTGSMTITEKRVVQFQAKFSPGSLGQSADTISPVITFDRCVIGCELQFFGDCAASGKPIIIVFNNCLFDGSGHRKQFLFLQYGAKYIVESGQLSIVDGTAVAQYNVILNNIKFINLDPDKATRALFKGFGSTYDRPDLTAGDHFDPALNALDQAIIMVDQKSAKLVDTISNASKEYMATAANQYYNFQAGSYSTVTNIKL